MCIITKMYLFYNMHNVYKYIKLSKCTHFSIENRHQYEKEAKCTLKISITDINMKNKRNNGHKYLKEQNVHSFQMKINILDKNT